MLSMGRPLPAIPGAYFDMRNGGQIISMLPVQYYDTIIDYYQYAHEFGHAMVYVTAGDKKWIRRHLFAPFNIRYQEEKLSMILEGEYLRRIPRYQRDKMIQKLRDDSYFDNYPDARKVLISALENAHRSSKGYVLRQQLEGRYSMFNSYFASRIAPMRDAAIDGVYLGACLAHSLTQSRDQWGREVPEETRSILSRICP